MGLNFDLNQASDTDSVIEVVCKFDECIDMNEEEYDKYIKSGASPELLILKKGFEIADCTLFVLRKNLNYEGNELLMRKQFIIDPVTKTPQANPAFVMTDIQTSLVDIKNPENAVHRVEYKQDMPGMASRKLIVGLYNSGILMDLFQARANASGGSKSALVEKKTDRSVGADV
jgi:hypothetical protein